MRTYHFLHNILTLLKRTLKPILNLLKKLLFRLKNFLLLFKDLFRHQMHAKSDRCNYCIFLNFYYNNIPFQNKDRNSLFHILEIFYILSMG